MIVRFNRAIDYSEMDSKQLLEHLKEAMSDKMFYRGKVESMQERIKQLEQEKQELIEWLDKCINEVNKLKETTALHYECYRLNEKEAVLRMVKGKIQELERS